VLFFCQLTAACLSLEGSFCIVVLREISVAEVARVGGFKAGTPNGRTTVIY